MQAKIFELWEDYQQNRRSAEQLLRHCAHCADGLLNAPGKSNVIENDDKMEVSYDVANEDDLLSKSDDDEQIPPF